MPKVRRFKIFKKVLLWGLPVVLFLLLVQVRYGIVPSAHTLKLRRELAEVTRVEIHVLGREATQPFTLQGEQAQAFVGSILIRDSLTGRPVSDLFPSPSSITYEFRFYRGSKLVLELNMLECWDRLWIVYGEGRGWKCLYPRSWQHIDQVVNEHGGFTSKIRKGTVPFPSSN